MPPFAPTLVPGNTVTVDRPFELVLAEARTGEETALAALYRSLQPALLGYLRARRPDDAEDVASETWISVARGLARFRGGEDEFRRWVFTIARRRLVDLTRSEARQSRVVSDDVLSHGLEVPDAETEALASVATREALELVASLPPHEAEVVLLRVVAGLSAADVAAVTGRTAVGVRVIQHRALRRLRGLVSTVLVTLQDRLAI